MLGREQEADRLARLPDDLRAGRSPRLIVRGEAGAGKTLLVECAIVAWEGVEVVRATGAEAEAEVPYLAVADLVRPLARRTAALGPEHAAALAALDRGAPPVLLDRFAIGRALAALLAAAAERRPVVVVVDDEQWVDAASLDSIHFAARRLLDAPVAVVLVRRDEGVAAPAPRDFEELVVAGLDDAAAAELLRASCPGRVAPAVVEAVVRSAGGNPLAIVEAPRNLAPEQLAGIRPLPDPLPVGGAIAAAFASRIAALPADTRRALALLAVAGPASAPFVGPALRRVGLGLEALDPAEAAGVVGPSGAAGAPGGLAFRHPLLRAAAAAVASPSTRRAVHGALADVLPAGDDRRAWHRAGAADGPDDDAAAALDEVGRSAGRLGGEVASSVAFERAAALTTDPRDAAERRLRAAEAAWRSGNLARAAALVAEVPAGALDPARRADRARLDARLLAAAERKAEAIAAFRRSAALAPHPGPAALALVEAARTAMRGAPGPDRPEALAAEALALAPVGTPAHLAATVADLAARRLAGGEADVPLEALRDRSLDLLASDLLEETGPLVTEAARLLAVSQDWAGALRLLEGLEAWARAQGNLTLLAVTRLFAGEVLNGRSRYGLARDAFEEARSLADATGDDDTRRRAEYFLVRLSLYLDSEEEVPEPIRPVLEAGGELALRARAGVGRRLLWGGRYDAACAHLEEVARVLDTVGWPDVATHLWEHDRVQALALAGRQADAEAALAEFEARAEATANPLVGAALATARVAVATRPGDVARHLEDALAIPEPTSYQRAAAHLTAGRRLAQLGAVDEAAGHLRTALGAVEGSGVDGPAAAVRRELERIGRPVAPEVPAATDPAAARAHAVDAQAGTLVRALGRFEVVVDGEPVGFAPAVAAAVKAVVAAGGSINAELLIDRFWPEADPETGRARLRTVLARVRRGAPGLLRRSGSQIELDPSVVVDALSFEADVDRLLQEPSPTATELRRAATAYRGPFLPDDLYESWAVATRARLERRYLALLERSAALAVAAGDLAEAEDLLDRAAAVEPDDEDRLVAAARLLAGVGRRTAAARFCRLAHRAARELGLPPSAALRALEAELALDPGGDGHPAG